MNERGQYGNQQRQAGKKGGWGSIALIAALSVGVYALSPGARYFYKHGKLPA